MQTNHTFARNLSFGDLTRRLDDQQYLCDPDFDFVSEELERQFDELRFAHQH